MFMEENQKESSPIFTEILSETMVLHPFFARTMPMKKRAKRWMRSRGNFTSKINGVSLITNNRTQRSRMPSSTSLSMCMCFWTELVLLILPGFMLPPTWLRFTTGSPMQVSLTMAFLTVHTGVTPDISADLQFSFWQPILYLDNEHSWPSSKEHPRHWLGVCHNIGDALTYWVLDDQSKQVLARSVVRPFHSNKWVK